MTATTRTTCPYCGVGCGVEATTTPTGIRIGGDPLHPANAGRLCSKGSALGDTLGWEGRLTAPQVRGRETGWDEALHTVATGFARIIREHGPDAVAFYVSGQLITEDYYVANKLMKGFIGSANIDTNSRLCMSSAVAAHKRAFGEDLVPMCYEDLEIADLVVLVGSNTAWCHPVLYQRIAAAKEQRPELKVVVIDPRRTATCEIADLHLGIRSGCDVPLFNGLFAWLHAQGHMDAAFVESHTRDLDRTLVMAMNTAGEIGAVANACGMEPKQVEAFYSLFAATPRVITAFSQGVNQSSSGTDKANSIINCHLLTGRIGKPGAGPFSLTGQPNAMGGREVGGLANQLAAHLDLEVPAHRQLVQEFWGSPAIASRPGYKAVDLFEAIHAGKVKAVWIMATNPVVSLPNANRVRAALERCELVVVSDCVAHTDTNALAHVLLPAAAWGEKDGTVTNSERRISRQRRFLDAPGLAQPDWWIVTEVAKRMGFADGFAYQSPQEIFIEHAALSGVGNGGSRAFDISGLSNLSAQQYDSLQPTQWPVPAGKVESSERLFTAGRFQYPDGRARFIATLPNAPVNATDEEYPFVLNTGRIRDQWHTMTRTAKAARLNAHLPEPFVEMHPDDALTAGVQEGGLVRVSTRWGRLVARSRFAAESRRRMIFVPIHWSGAFSSDARVGALVNPVVDPVSGEPEFKHTPARVAPFVVAWHGFALSRRPLDMQDTTWWTHVRGEQFLRYELAGRRMFGNWSPWARRLLRVDSPGDWIDYADSGNGSYRAAHLVDGRMDACLFISPRPDLPSRAWLAGLFAREQLEAAERQALLIGRPTDASVDSGPVVCSCHGVGRNTLRAAIEKGRLTSVREIGQKLKAGTNCGSCIPELKALLSPVR